jgi:hypothetical protein
MCIHNYDWHMLSISVLHHRTFRKQHISLHGYNTDSTEQALTRDLRCLQHVHAIMILCRFAALRFVPRSSDLPVCVFSDASIDD